MNIIDEFKKKLDNPGTTEHDIQMFLEDNTELIPLPYLDNHHLHMNVIISKLLLSNDFITDFAYLTKSSNSWHLVLIELESCNKGIFNNTNQIINFTAKFNNAYDQILSWRAYMEKNKDAMLNTLEEIRVPLSKNNLYFKYVLIIGRSKEMESSQKRKDMMAQKSRDDIIVMTYDSIVSHYEHNPSSRNPKLILSPWGEKGFTVKKVPKQADTSIFAYILPDYLKFAKNEDIDDLKQQGFHMDSWLKGQLLKVNNKYTCINQMAEDTQDPIIKLLGERDEEQF